MLTMLARLSQALARARAVPLAAKLSFPHRKPTKETKARAPQAGSGELSPWFRAVKALPRRPGTQTCRNLPAFVNLLNPCRLICPKRSHSRCRMTTTLRRFAKPSY